MIWNSWHSHQWTTKTCLDCHGFKSQNINVFLISPNFICDSTPIWHMVRLQVHPNINYILLHISIYIYIYIYISLFSIHIHSLCEIVWPSFIQNGFNDHLYLNKANIFFMEIPTIFYRWWSSQQVLGMDNSFKSKVGDVSHISFF